MSIKFYNPPVALLSLGNKEGVEIGGSLSVLALDSELNLHTVKTIFAELSWGQFWKEEDIHDQIESITVKHEDNKSLSDPEELVNRLVDAFRIIQIRGWIFFGIADFESNSFMDQMLIEGLDYRFIERLMVEHKRVRDQAKFPQLINASMIQSGNAYISVKFNGKTSNLFHYPLDTSLFTIFNKIKPIIGNSTGIVCTSQGAANFYILSENIHLQGQPDTYRIDIPLLEQAFQLMKKNIIFPISWFKINIGLSGLKSLGLWDDIKNNNELKEALLKYFTYVKELQKQHLILEEKKKETSIEEFKDIDYKSMSQEEKAFDLKAIEDLMNLEDLGLFRKDNKNPTS